MIRKKTTLFAQGRLLKVVAHGRSVTGKFGKRSNVQEFSKASRLRLLQKLATINVDGEKPVFITLTYGTLFPTPKEAKRHLDSFLKRIARKFPFASALWRFEFQQRGAPHFHLIFFGLPFLPKRKLKFMWGAVIGKGYWDLGNGRCEAPFTRIELLNGYRHAAAYVSKYVAKVSDGGFNIASYLTASGEFLHPETDYCDGSVGRWWGVFNEECIPYAPKVTFEELRYDHDAFCNLLRGISRAAGYRVGKYGGVSRFVDNPYRWLEYWCYLSIVA